MAFLKDNYQQIAVSIMSALLVLALYLSVKQLAHQRKYRTNAAKKQGLSGFNFMKVIYAYSAHKKKLLISFFIVSVIIFVLIFKNLIFSILLSVCLALVIDDFIKSLRKQNEHKLHTQAISFINHMILMLKAGKTVRQVFGASLKWTSYPFKSYLESLVNEIELSIPFEEAIDNFSQRSFSKEIKLLASALKINHKTGGDLIFVLENVIKSLRHSLEARSKSKTLTIQSRYSATIISFFPIAVLVLLYFFMTDKISAFFQTGLSNAILIAGGSLEVAGIMAMRKILGSEK